MTQKKVKTIIRTREELFIYCWRGESDEVGIKTVSKREEQCKIDVKNAS